MTKRARYLLIFIGFIFFIISAPLIVIYVRGLRFDFSTKKFVHTGVLAVNIEPDSSQILLDNKPAKTTSKNIRFLLPKDYQISVSKDGFLPWQKKLTIQSDQVTWINSGVEKIFLLKASSQLKTLAENVTDYISDGNKIIFYDNKNIYLSSGYNQKNIKKIVLPENITKQKLNIIPNAEYSDALLFTYDSLKQTPNKIFITNFSQEKIQEITSVLASNAQTILLNNGKVLSLENNILFLADTISKTKTVVKNNVQAFNYSDGIYTLTSEAENLYLNFQELNSPQSQILLKNLPTLNSPQILISENKQIFILADEGLFKINSGLEKISDKVSDWYFYHSLPSIIYSSYGEINYYDFIKQQSKTITRTSARAGNLRISQKIGYAFFLKGTQINALELDDRGNQNEYILYNSQSIKKFEIDSDFKNILVLDGNNLSYFTLR